MAQRTFGSFRGRVRPRLESLEERTCLSTMTLTAVHSGFWDDAGAHDGTNLNYVAGQWFDNPRVLQTRNYSVFNLASVDAPILGAQLRLANPRDGYFSPDPTETFTLFDVSTPLAEVRASGTGRVDIFNDLGGGTVYGEVQVSRADDGRLVSIPLNGAALAYLNAQRDGQAALGGALTTIEGGAQQYVFGFSAGGIPRELVLEVLDPAGPFLVTQTPIRGRGPMGNLRVTFDRAVDPASFTREDVPYFEGPLGLIPVTGVDVVSGSGDRQFDIRFPQQVVTGIYAMNVGPDIRDQGGNPMDQNRNFQPGESDDYFLAMFGIEGARVTAATPNDDVNGPVEAVRVTFSQPIRPESFTPLTSVSLWGPSGRIAVREVAVVPDSDDRQFDVIPATPPTELGHYTLFVGPDVRDVWGNPMDQDNDLIGGEWPDDVYPATFRVVNNFTVVVPNHLAKEEGNQNNVFPFHIAALLVPSMRYQQIYARAEFSEGGTIDKIRFRQDAAQGSAFSSSGIDIQINLGYSARGISDAAPVFADNIGKGYVTVFDGLLSLSSAASTQSPRPFDITINVEDLFFYDPSQGDLLLDIRMRNSASTTRFDLADSAQQSSTIRIVARDVDAASGNVGLSGEGRPYGLVTQFEIARGEAPAPAVRVDVWVSELLSGEIRRRQPPAASYEAASGVR